MCLTACSLVGNTILKEYGTFGKYVTGRKALRDFYPGSTFNLSFESHFLLKMASGNFLF